MADSARWRELAAQFRELPADCQMLRADRHYIVNTGGVGRWNLVGSISSVVRFEALARRAGAELPSPVTHDLLTAWLEAVMAQGDSGFKSNPIAIEMNADGTNGVQHVTGSMYDLPVASANFCAMQESWALQAEYEKSFPNDPKNWSQFRQQYEALRSLREIHNEPPERISEQFVRETIARIHNIKPEDVTDAQIRFEIAGLLSSARRHIELVPSTAKDTRAADPVPSSEPMPAESLPIQIKRLRDDCRWTNEELAEAAGLSVRQVSRHIAGESAPYPRNISAYERAFSKQLKRQIVISKMS